MIEALYRRVRRSPGLRVLLAGVVLCSASWPVAAGGGKGQQSISQQIQNAPPAKRAQYAREAAQIRMLLGDMTRPIGPTEEALAPVKEKLSKAIKIQFLDTPFERVIEFLQRESGVTILIDRHATAGLEQGIVALEADQMTLKEALDWACLVTDTDWDVIKGVVVISTANAIQVRQAVTKVYDVRGLIFNPPNFTSAPEFDLNSALSNTSSGGSSGGAQSATTLFSDEGIGDQPTRMESIDQLITLIQDTVGHQADWAAYGGNLGSVRELSGNLIIRATPARHKDIADLLARMSEGQDRMISVEARYILVKSRVLEDLIKKNEGEFIIPADKLEAFLTAAGSAENGSKSLGTNRLVMFNGQRTHLTAWSQKAFLSDVEPVSGGDAGLDPTLSVQESGAQIDVEATVAQGGKSIVMTFRGAVVTGIKAHESPIPSGGVDRGASVQATTKVEQGQKEVVVDGDVMPGKRTGAAYAKLIAPEQDLVTYRTSVSIPNGGAVLMTGASVMIKSLPMEDSEVVLIVRARSKEAVKKEEAKKEEAK